LKFLNQVSSGGNGPCHLALDSDGKNVLAANYGAGSAAALPLSGDGRLKELSSLVHHSGSGPNLKRQEKPHAHCVIPSQDDRFALVADLGIDQILVYRFDSQKGLLTAADPPSAKLPPGAGPRQLTFHPKGHWLYLLNELQCTMTLFAFDPAD